MFPFKYRGRAYASCTTKNSKFPWCSLTSNYDKDKKWENAKIRATSIRPLSSRDGSTLLNTFAVIIGFSNIIVKKIQISTQKIGSILKGGGGGGGGTVRDIL